MLDMFQYDFIQRAFIVGIAIGLLCPVLGLFLVLRRSSLIGDTLAHVSLAGVAAGLLMNVYPVGVALLFSLLAGVGIEKLREKYRHYGELAIAVILSFSIGLAAVLLSLGRSVNNLLFSYLFGSILTLTRQDIWVILSLGAAVLIIIALFFKEWFFITFDEDLAQVGGLPVRSMNVLFMALSAIVVAIAIRVVGILLISSLMVLPVAASIQIARSFRNALLWAIVFAEASVLAGLFTAYVLDLAPGGTIVLISVALLFMVIGGRQISTMRMRRGEPQTSVGL